MQGELRTDKKIIRTISLNGKRAFFITQSGLFKKIMDKCVKLMYKVNHF